MIIPAVQVLAYLGDRIDVPDLPVRNPEGELLFVADAERICELAEAGQICGNMRGSRLRFVELLVPLSEIFDPRGEFQTPGSINARTNIGAYRQHLENGVCWSLYLARVGA